MRKFAVCIDNSGYPASLELLKVYELPEDRRQEKHGLLPVIDESGESYLYSSSMFLPISFPEGSEEVLEKLFSGKH